MMTDKLEVPRRRVRKDWYVGLNPDPVDRSHPDVKDDQLVQEAADMKLFSRKLINKSLQEVKTLNIRPSNAAHFLLPLLFNINLSTKQG